MADALEFDLGKYLFALDGRVLEIFGPIHPEWNISNQVYVDSWRVHVTQLNVKVTGPDKKGLHEVAFLTQPSMGAKPNGLSVVRFSKLDDAQRNRFQPLLDALAKATGATPPASGSDGLLATKTSALQALLNEHGVRLGSQPEDVRNAVVVDLQAAGVPIDPKSLAIAPTDPGQMDAMLEIYQRHGLLPPDASIG